MSKANQIRMYDPKSCAVFLKTKERFGGLSNMAAGFPLEVNGIPIRTSEALYQACRFPLSPEVQKQIFSEASPMTAKMRSKPFRGNTRPDWEVVRVRIMRWCLRVKLAQNFSTFSELLLSTEEAPIVEKKTRQKDFWGATETPDGTLIGMNVLGRLLMELREEIKLKNFDELKWIHPLKIPNFLILESAIEKIKIDKPPKESKHHSANVINRLL